MIEEDQRYNCWPAFHTKGDCFVHLDKKVGCIPIPRNASTTIKGKWPLGKGQDGVDTGVLRRAGFIKSNFCNHKHNNFFWFTFLRDPVLRFLSGVVRYHEFRENPPKSNCPPKISADLAGFYPDISISELIEKLSERNFCIFELQNWFIEGVDFNYIGKVEALEEDLTKILHQVGIPQPPIVSANISKSKKYVLSADNIMKLNDFYALDFHLYKSMS